MTTQAAPPPQVRKGKDWLDSWNPEDPQTWDSGRAWKTLWITTFNLTLAFIAWFLASALAPKLKNLGFDISDAQLYWLVAMPGLAGGTLRLIWTFLPPISWGPGSWSRSLPPCCCCRWSGGDWRCRTPRRLTASCSYSACCPASVAAPSPDSCPAPRILPKGQAGDGPGTAGRYRQLRCVDRPVRDPGHHRPGYLGNAQLYNDATNSPPVVDKAVHYQNAAYIWIPFVIVGVILAWTLLRSVPVQTKGVKEQMDISRRSTPGS